MSGQCVQEKMHAYMYIYATRTRNKLCSEPSKEHRGTDIYLKNEVRSSFGNVDWKKRKLAAALIILQVLHTLICTVCSVQREQKCKARCFHRPFSLVFRSHTHTHLQSPRYLPFYNYSSLHLAKKQRCSSPLSSPVPSKLPELKQINSKK